MKQKCMETIMCLLSGTTPRTNQDVQGVEDGTEKKDPILPRFKGKFQWELKAWAQTARTQIEFNLLRVGKVSVT